MNSFSQLQMMQQIVRNKLRQSMSENFSEDLQDEPGEPQPRGFTDDAESRVDF